MYTVYKLKCASPLALALRLHQDFLKVHLWIIKAAVSRAQRRSYSVSHLHRVSRFPWRSKQFSTQKFQWKPTCCGNITCISIISIIWFLGSQGVCGLILNAKHLKESAKNIVSRWDSVRSPSQHGDQRRLKTSSTFSGRWVYPTVLQDLLPVLRHNTSAAVTSPWRSNKLKGGGQVVKNVAYSIVLRKTLQKIQWSPKRA